MYTKIVCLLLAGAMQRWLHEEIWNCILKIFGFKNEMCHCCYEFEAIHIGCPCLGHAKKLL
jgi:hypothetical protein